VQSTREEGRFDENDQRLLATIAANVGVAIERARLFEETQRTLFCSDLVHQGGEHEAVTSGDVVGRVAKTLREYEAGPFASYVPWTARTRPMLERLAALEINDVWVEAGAGFNGALLAAGLIDELVVYMAPRLFGDTARGMFSVPALESLAAAWRLELDDVRQVGPDLRITARVARVAAA
jgi:riboflavin biosynthesis pyrimidine reductase